MPSARKGPSLPGMLLKEMGGAEPPARPGKPSKHRDLSRKERRKSERTQKKHRGAAPTDAPAHSRRHTAAQPRHAEPDDVDSNPRKKRRLAAADDGRDDGRDERPPRQASTEGRRHEPSDDDLLESDASDDELEGLKAAPKATRGKLYKEDAEIAELEKKLGLRGRKSLPKAFRDEGLLDILGDLGDDSDEEAPEKTERRKRKAEADEWLAQKRKKARRPADDSLDEDGDEVGEGGLGSNSSDEELGSDFDDDDDFSGFGSGLEDEQPREKPRARENPYVAPPTAPSAAYVPPARRREAAPDSEATARIRRQVQGLVNRLTDSNMVAILDDIEKLYREHPRQNVTSSLVDAMLAQICDAASLPDTLLILTAGFATAVFKVVGMDFGAYLIQCCVARFREHYAEARAASVERPDVSKQTSNLITFMSELYNFQLVGCNLIFDYIRLLLEDLVELNAELLLRTIRMSGPLLRQDDPLALKDIVAMIRPAVARAGEANISVRTKFMIETINDLKNNKMKAGASATAVITEHTTRMKKALGSLSSRKLKATEPLRIGLRDIEDAEKRGKWWLVGARWAGNGDSALDRGDRPGPGHDGAGVPAGGGGDDDDDSADDEEAIAVAGGTDGDVDLAAIAREQMMNTDVRRSIFMAIMSATDYEDAYVRILRLRLSKDRQREIPNVLIQCAGAEQQHNPYYSLIARRLCTDRKIRWAFQDALWKLFRRLGESIFGDEAPEDEDEEALDMRRLVNVGKLYGTLIADGSQGLAVLKCLSLIYLRPKTKALVEVLLITALVEAQARERHAGKGDGASVERMFQTIADLPELCRGLQYFLRKVVKKSDLVGSSSDSKKVARGCRAADGVLEAALRGDTADA